MMFNLPTNDEARWYEITLSHLLVLGAEYECILFEGSGVMKYQINMAIHFVEVSMERAFSESHQEMRLKAIAIGKKMSMQRCSCHTKCHFHLTAMAHLKALHTAYERMEPPDLLAIEQVALAIFCLERSIYNAFAASEAQATMAQAINAAAKIISYPMQPVKNKEGEIVVMCPGCTTICKDPEFNGVGLNWKCGKCKNAFTTDRVKPPEELIGGFLNDVLNLFRH